MLRGTHEATVDDKGRVKIPAAFLESLREYGNKFYVTSESGESVRVYPMKVWTKIEDKLASKPSYNRAKQKFLMQTSYYGQVAELDGQGRLLLPQILREAAQAKGQVFVMGELDHLRIWNSARFEAIRKVSGMTPEELNELEI